jgi:hypothetical protein
MKSMRLSQTITFIDSKEVVVRSYGQFIEETIECASAWSIISKIGFAITLYAIQRQWHKGLV